MAKYFFLAAYFLFFPYKSYALSCFPPVPDNIYLIKSPVIFNGTVVGFEIHRGENGKVVSKDIKFKVNEMVKGPNVKYINIKSISIMGYPPNFGIGSTKTIIPDILKDGSLAISYCSSGLRYQSAWESKARYAYSLKFPTLFLLWNGYKYLFIMLFISIPLSFLIFKGFIFVFKRMLIRGKSNGSAN